MPTYTVYVIETTSHEYTVTAPNEEAAEAQAEKHFDEGVQSDKMPEVLELYVTPAELNQK